MNLATGGFCAGQGFGRLDPKSTPPCPQGARYPPDPPLHPWSHHLTLGLGFRIYALNMNILKNFRIGFTYFLDLPRLNRLVGTSRVLYNPTAAAISCGVVTPQDCFGGRSARRSGGGLSGVVTKSLFFSISPPNFPMRVYIDRLEGGVYWVSW